MNKAEAVNAYLKQQEKSVPEHLRGVFVLFSDNLTVLIAQQESALPDTILQACFCQPKSQQFKKLLRAFRGDRTMSRGDFSNILGRIYENQNLLYDGEQTYKTKFPTLTAGQVKESCQLAQGWAKGVLAAWNQKGSDQRQAAKRQVHWGDSLLVNGGPPGLVQVHEFSPEEAPQSVKEPQTSFSGKVG